MYIDVSNVSNYTKKNVVQVDEKKRNLNVFCDEKCSTHRENCPLTVTEI